MAEQLLWLDVETTGIGVREHKLLEVAMVMTEFHRDFHQIGQEYHVILKPQRLVDVLDVPPVVLQMHVESGLWGAIYNGLGISESEAIAQLREVMKSWNLEEATVYLAGRSVHFDKEWLFNFVPNDLLPHFRLSHRIFDLTSIKAYEKLRGKDFSVPDDNHRALTDVLVDIDLARKLLERTALDGTRQAL